jgi:hypothetical protein
MSRENLFSINLDSEKVIDREELILRKESDELAAKRAELNKRLSGDILKSVNKSVFSSLFPIISTFIAFVLCAIALRDEGKISPLPFALAGVFLVMAVVLVARNKKREKSNDDHDLDAIDGEYAVFNELVKKELGIPEKAKEIEIFTDMYSEEDKDADKIYTNDTAYVFKEGDIFCFGYGSVVLGIPLSAIESIVRVDEEVAFESWGKDVPYDRGNYMQYKIKKIEVDKYDEYYSMNGYYSLRFTELATDFEVVIPLYDIEPVIDILKIKPISE